MKDQKIFTFSRFFSKTYRKGYVPLGYISAQDEFKAQLVKQGYLAKDIVVEECILVRAIGARANVSLHERKKLQNQIDEQNTVEHKTMVKL